jgi:hypothetical protein
MIISVSYDRRRRWQLQTEAVQPDVAGLTSTVKCTARLVVLCSLYQTVFPDLYKFSTCVFREVVFSEYPTVAKCLREDK